NGKSTVYAKSMPYTKINFFNNTLIDNVSPYGCEFEGNIYCRNNIMRNIGDYEIALFYDPEITSYLWCSHNNILGGEDAIFNQFGANVVYWEEGNIDVDPQFVLVGDDPYQLAAGSLCIDAGTPDTTGMFLPPWDMLENHRVWDGDGNGEARIDMGCYEFDSEPWAYAHQPVVPAVDYQISNYPNPFNPSTTICFTVPQQGAVKLHVYNIRGQKVATLVDCVSAPGSYNVQWDGRDADNRPVGGGVYFAQLVTPQRTTAHKMILIK
ncbi:MAG: T9SS type A sorting domain-containing protein, partial [Candidatus Cloacimonetes bacterium]|nr:T9SS type A sorting domain-containing protein [Candidatus Cloacimonadota bacterium]